MKKTTLPGLAILAIFACSIIACQKENQADRMRAEAVSPGIQGTAANAESNFNLEIVLHGAGNQVGHLRFRQERDAAKVIDLGVNVYNLKPDAEYLLQRAVDPINMVDGNCSSNSWLTLGYGLAAGSIHTNEKGDGEADLWRDVTAIPSGSVFDIHFRVIDAVTLEVVLTSDCYQYTVR